MPSDNPDSAAATLPHILKEGAALHCAGKLEEAEQRYRQALAIDRNHPDALHLLGVLAHQAGTNDAAAELIASAIRVNPTNPHYHANLSLVLLQLTRREEAVAAAREALRLEPRIALAHFNLGVASLELGRLGEATTAFEAAIACDPGNAEAYGNLGLVLRRLGRFEEAARAFAAALQRKPDYAEVQCNLGNTLKDLGRPEEAVASYRAALACNADLAAARLNLGITLKEMGRTDEALDCALGLLQRQETPEARLLFADCAARADAGLLPADARSLLERALSEGWARPSALAPLVIRLIRQNPAVARFLERATRSPGWSEEELAEAIGELARISLLRAYLRTGLNHDPALEQLLTLCRSALLRRIKPDPARCPPEALLDFSCALAQQCFINEYVFAYASAEESLVRELRESFQEAVSNGRGTSAQEIAVLACYVPLHSLPDAERLLDLAWPRPVQDLLAVQIAEPVKEQELRGLIPRLTAIAGNVSGSVQAHYEENPYPRWIGTDPGMPYRSIGQYVRTAIGGAPVRIREEPNPDILIAGGGTGQHPIQVAMALPTARILAVDLSLSSLSYAMRKAQELSLSNLEFAQADILELGKLGRKFDVIESVGVLHHLGEPSEGLGVLVSLLRSDGLMKLGFYSAIARAGLAPLRRYIAEQGYRATAEDIRRCRQRLLAGAAGPLPPAIGAITDFASISGCRDLLFHVQEHCLTLPEITDLLEKFDLAFLGFAGTPDVLHGFRQQFPRSGSEVDLALWHRYETENPGAFIGMYQFWAQKRS